jgi:hypothetical protein
VLLKFLEGGVEDEISNFFRTKAFPDFVEIQKSIAVILDATIRCVAPEKSADFLSVDDAMEHGAEIDSSRQTRTMSLLLLWALRYSD